MRIEVNVITGEVTYHEDDIIIETPVEPTVQPTVEENV